MSTNPLNPFKGLRPYREEDQEILFGRDRDLILIKDRICSARTTLLFAGSGVGKTSFLNAKVIPELRKEYAVVWHNRWTGTDEVEIEGSEPSTDDKIKWWPPSVLIRNLVKRFRPARQSKVTTTDNSKERANDSADRDDLTREVQKTVAQCLRSNPQEAKKRLPQVFSGFKKDSLQKSNALSAGTSTSTDAVARQPGESTQPLEQKDWCILILDQFEEVFQYHAYEDYFKTFLKDLSDLINQDYRIRVIFAMREEFLGELSVFDNLIPDLFSNYYRLKHPDRVEAQNIIRRTSELSEIKADREKLAYLVDDLATERRDAARQSGTNSRTIKRNFIALPYLQIACERLWREQYGQKADAVSVETDQPPPVPATILPPFLYQYQPASPTGNGARAAGDAQRVLREFCLEKLGQPFLTEREQDLVGRSFDFLVTRQGAKMAYELTSLAHHMNEEPGPLKDALEKLSQHDARILRESRGPDRSYWFELYHDMYAAIVDDWKRGYQKVRDAQLRRKLIRRAALPAIVLFLIFGVPHWITNPIHYRSIIIRYQSELQQSAKVTKEIDKPVADREAIIAYSNLRTTFGYQRYADSLWADVLESRAVLYGRQGERDKALLSLLKAATLRFTSSGADADLAKAESLMADDYPFLQRTYANDVDNASISRDGKTVLTVSRNQEVALWNADTGDRLATICSDCKQALFSRDGKVVVTLGVANLGRGGAGRTDGQTGIDAQPTPPSAKREPKREEDSGARPTQYEVKFWDTAHHVIHKPITIDLEKLKQPAAQTPNSTPSRGTTSAARTDFSPPKLQSVAGTESNYRVVVTTDDGILVGQSSSGDVKNVRRMEYWEWDEFELSPDGSRLVATEGFGSPTLWKINEQQLNIDQQIKPPLVDDKDAFAFSPDGTFLLAIHDDKKVRLWKLNSTEDPRTIGEGENITDVVFSRDGKQFLIVKATNEDSSIVDVLDSSSLQKLYTLKVNGTNTTFDLRSDIKGLITRQELDVTFYEHWDLPTGKLLGRFVLEGSETSSYGLAYSSGATEVSVFAMSHGAARLWKLNPISSRGTVLRGDGAMRYRSMSTDAATMLTVTASKMQLWSLESGKPLSGLIDRSALLLRNLLSPQGKYLAAITGEKSLNITQVSDPSSVITLSYPEKIETYAFSPDDQILGVGTASGIYISAPTSPSPMKLTATAGISSLRFSPDGKYVVAIFPGSFRVPQQLLKATQQARMKKPEFKTLRVWALPAGNEVSLADDLPRNVQFNLGRDGKMVTNVIGKEPVVRLWDLSNGLELARLPHNDRVRTAVLSPDAKWAMTADQAGVVRLWNTQTFEQMGTLKLPSASASFIFSTDPQKVLIKNGLWLYRFSFDQSGFHYLGGLVPGRANGLRPTSPDGEQIRLVRRVDDSSVEFLNLSFKGNATASYFKSSPQAALAEFGKSMGLTIDSLGQITNVKE